MGQCATWRARLRQLSFVWTSLFIAQAVAEYGMLQALVAGFNAARYRVEMYVGEGNSKYLLLGMLAVLILLLVRRRR